MFESLFKRERLSLDRLRTLVEIEHAGSISKAAPGNLTRQSQFSRQLKELEQFFGTELAVRRGRRLELNDEGHRLAQIGKEILIKLESFYATRISAHIVVTLGAYESLIHWRLAGRMDTFQREFPRAECHLTAHTTSEIISGLVDLTIDFGVVRHTALRPPLKGQNLFHMEYAIFVARDKVPPSYAKDALWILKNIPLALHESAGEFKQALKQGTKATDLHVRLRCDTAVQSSRAVLSGNYCSILPAIAVEEFDENKYLRLKPPMLQDYRREICLAWNPRLLELREGFSRLKDRLVSCLQ